MVTLSLATNSVNIKIPSSKTFNYTLYLSELILCLLCGSPICIVLPKYNINLTHLKHSLITMAF